MGGNFSAERVREDLLNYLHQSEVNELMQKVNVVINAQNAIIFKNIAQIAHVTITFANDVKNQIIAKLVLDSTKKTSVYNEILNKITELQHQGGIFEINARVFELMKKLQNLTDLSQINEMTQDIRNQFDIVNTFQVINDNLLPTSYLQYVDLSATNQLYNSELYDQLEKIYQDITHDTKDDEKHDSDQDANNTTAILMVGAVLLVGGIIYLKRGK